jgi:hypothetical protein
VTGRNWPKASGTQPSTAAKLDQGTGAVTMRARDWGGTVAHSLPAWRWPDDHAVFTAGSSTAWGRSQAR